jgi:hypothetical protein
MTSRQFAEWIAYAQLRGMPGDRADFRAGQICATFANVHRAKDAKPFGPAQFIPPLDPLEGLDEIGEPPIPEELDLKALAAPLAKLFGKKEV